MTSQGARDFAALLEQERLAVDARVHEFVADLLISRQLYGMIKRGDRRPSPDLLSRAVTKFPHIAESLTSAWARAEEERKEEQERRRNLRSAVDDGRKKMLSILISAGRVPEAKAGIERALNESSAPAMRVWLLERLAEVSETPETVEEALQRAVEVAHAGGLHDEELRLYLTLARRRHVSGNYRGAHEVIDEALSRHPRSGELWRRKAVTHWYEHEYASALACLETAHKNGLSDKRLVHTRGQILGEWGLLEEAYADLTRAIELAASPANEAYARSSRAYVIGREGDLATALSEFALAESVTPLNAWLHYYRALSHLSAGDREAAASGMIAALTSDVPPLNAAKAVHARILLSELGVDPHDGARESTH